MDNLIVIDTGDGSHSVFNKELDETYHSRHGAIQESVHVFIRQGLDLFLPLEQESICIFEVGFGTGLNALLAWQWASNNKRRVDYLTIEPFPLDEKVWRQLNYAKTLNLEKEYGLLHQAPWDVVQTMSAYFTFQKKKISLQHVASALHPYDLVFFDAFAPDKQPDMWALQNFKQLNKNMRHGATLVTYCAKGQVKRDLKAAGFSVEALPGPPGKREMVRATS